MKIQLLVENVFNTEGVFIQAEDGKWSYQSEIANALQYIENACNDIQVLFLFSLYTMKEY